MGRWKWIAIVFASVTWASATLIPGGGKSASDCYVEFDVAGATGGNKITCVDGDPACDADGQCQGVCTFSVALCANQANVAGCTPKPFAKPLKINGASLTPVDGTGSACGAFADVPVALKGKKRTKKGKKTLRVTAVVDGTPKKETDRLVLLCTPREGACPTTTTTVVTTSTTTTTILATLDAQALVVGAKLVAFSDVDPSFVDTPVELVGLNVGDALVSIDRRARNGLLYGLGFNAVAGTVQLYALHPSTGIATPIGASGTYVDDGGDPVTIGDGVGTRFGMDVDPRFDRIRVVASNGQNFRMNPNTGAFVDGDLGGAPGSVPGLNTDGPINGTTSTVQETAYTDVGTLATVSTQYTMDASIDALCIQNAPNSGTQTACKPLGAAIDAVLGFDIPPGVDAPSSNAAASGQGVAVVRPAGQPSEFLASVDLATGALGTMAPIGTSDVLGIALQKPPAAPIVGLLADGTGLLRFTSDAPGTTVSVALSGVNAGETMVGIAFRPQTGQLYGFAVNATSNKGSLYLLDSQTGSASAVGVAGQVEFVEDDGTSAIDFPDPAVAGWGMDFNPTVDRVRVVSSSGLNFRVNPNTGAPIDGNFNGTMPIPPGVNPDGPIDGAVAGVDAVAYTNGVGQDLGASNPTTVYTLDAVTDGLYIQNPPNAGTQTAAATITLGGVPLDFTSRCGFDIPSEVSVETSNTPVTAGSAYAALTVGGVTSLYAIDLPTGAATNLGAIDTGAASLKGIAVGRTTLD